ncbi:hypothetical protein SLA_3826 [Streptomyces laurentii]|uniref:Uncharacterized protein n=1 Tax=Streptomyces laurentii TaxID=39478 RepID=A0A169NNJ1_STRLU|nr:hypothetical protein SLA_3826 [Streptomyces laurentii]
MKNIVAGREPVTATEFVELALGIDVQLFTGPAVETELERKARLDVAHEVLAELRESDPDVAAYAASLLRTLPLKHRPTGRSPRRTAGRPTGVTASKSAVAA